MKPILALLLAVSVFGAPSFSNVNHDNVTAHGVRLTWTTNAATNNYVLLDTVDPPIVQRTPLGSGPSSTEHGYTFLGLAAGTLHYYRVCGDAGGVGCSSSGSFTTLAAEPGFATPPIAPAKVDVSPITVTGTTYNVASDCSNLQSQIAAAAANMTMNHEVVIPGGTVCLGRYTLPARSGASGWVTLKSGGVLPPFGTRTSLTLGVNNAKIISPMVGLEHYQTTTPGSAEVGAMWLDSDSTNANAFLHIWNGSSWAAQAMASSATDPTGACTVGAFSYNTVTSDPKSRVSWCDATGTWRLVYLSYESTEEPWAGLGAVADATKYRIEGITIEPFRIPSTYSSILPTGSGTGNGDQRASNTYCLAYMATGSSYIIWDRVILDGIGHPQRARRAFCRFNGTHQAFINGVAREINFWRPANSLETTPSAIINYTGVGPFLIENNDFPNCHGVCIFFSDSAGSGVPSPQDITIRRNTIYEPAVNNQGDATSNGRLYYRRHQMECKRCVRVLVEGNEFNGGWPWNNAPSGAQIALTPRNDNCALKLNAIQIADVQIRSNWFRYSPQVLLATGQNDSQGTCNTMGMIRLAITNNVIDTTGKTESGDVDGLGANDLNGQVMDVGLGIEDFQIRHNAFLRISSACCSAHMMSHGWSDLNSRLWIDGNIYTSLVAVTQGYWGISGQGSRGTAMLNNLWKAGGVASHQVTGNAMQVYYNGAFRDDPPDGAYPTPNYRSETVSNFTGALRTCAFCKVNTLSVVKPDSIFAAGSGTARAADGYANGPDYVELESALGETHGLAHPIVGTTTATITYTAPDGNACTVEHGISASPMTGDRVSDGGGARPRNVNLTGLTGATVYHYRVYCARAVAGTFTTQ